VPRQNIKSLVFVACLELLLLPVGGDSSYDENEGGGDGE